MSPLQPQKILFLTWLKLVSWRFHVKLNYDVCKSRYTNELTEEEEEKVAKCLVETIKCHLYLFVSRPQSSYIQ